MAPALTMFPFTSKEVQEQFVSAEQLMRACDQVWSADRKADIASSAASLVRHPASTARSTILSDCSTKSGRPAIAWFWSARKAIGRLPRNSSIDARRRLHIGSARTFKRRRAIERPAAWSGEFLLRHHSQGAPDRRGFAPFRGRSNWLYVNFRTTTNPAVREPVMHHFRSLRKENWVTVQEAGAQLWRLPEGDDVPSLRALSARQWH